ncbi:hypothetical protein BJ944DRAFT_10194 [Cunninghamella echinulata]|nr:hypothetical protein BJ944DRAFT_10194 [Cunninghamella echinulata]
MSSETSTNENTRTRYWCHACGREVEIYMAPDPTCQRCNQQFIEEIDDTGNDDPRTFLNQGEGGSTTTILMDNSDNEDGMEDEIFQFIRGLTGGTTGGTARFQFSTAGGGRRTSQADNNDHQDNEESNPNNNNENNNTNRGTNTNENPMMGGNTQMANMLQNLLSNIFDSNRGNNATRGTTNTTTSTDDEQDTNNGDNNENNNSQQQQQQRRTPVVIYGGVVDGGNIQFRTMNPNDRSETGGNGPTAFFQMGSNLGNLNMNQSTGGDDGGENNTNTNNRPELSGMQG